MAEQFGLGVPARGRSADDLPRDLPLLVVRAGKDETPGLNASVDAFVRDALARVDTQGIERLAPRTR